MLDYMIDMLKFVKEELTRYQSLKIELKIKVAGDDIQQNKKLKCDPRVEVLQDGFPRTMCDHNHGSNLLFPL